MSLYVFNTMSRRLEPFEPIEAGRVRMYTCGPTVYNYAHVGNLRAYMFEDLLRRYLRFRGFDVFQVMNLTDVDDKTIRSAREEGLSLNMFTQRYKDAFFEDLRILGIEPADKYPAATDHIPQMIELIQRLFEKDLAYRSDDGSVYFSIARFPEYGKLAHLCMDGLRHGARVNQDEYEKEHVGDFALWKAWTEEDGDVGWDSPWGRGRPGWHIECSAMSMSYLGESFDLHCGGVDNIFPHHEDEIAQSEGATGKPFARYWMHNAHLIVEGSKMSKSLGNFYTLRDLLAKGYSGREVRYLLVATHYRNTLNFTFHGLDAARAALARLDEFRQRLRDTVASTGAGALPDWAAARQREFVEQMDNDLNVSGALAALFELVSEGNRLLDAGQLSAAEAAAVGELLSDWDRVLGVLTPAQEEAPPDVLERVAARAAAREAREWAEADRIRDELLAMGWSVKDTPQGPRLKRSA